MRPRKRTDWPISVYRYWVNLDHASWSDLPTNVTHEAEAMRALWNQLVEAFAQYQETYQKARQSSPEPALDTQTDSRSAAQTRIFKQLRESLNEEALRLTGECPAGWANSRFVLTQFQAAVSRFFGRHGNPPHSRTAPFHKVHFCHQFTAGGLPVERIFGQHIQRLHLEPVSPEAFNTASPQRQRKRLARTSGLFQVGNAALTFRTILHRPLPEGAYLKTAALVGQQIMAGGYHKDQNGGHDIAPRWQWSLHLTVEIPPAIIPTPARAITTGAALRLEGALWEDRQLRLGMLSDSTGREEALLLPQTILEEWRHKRALQGQVESSLEQLKSQLRDHHERAHLPAPAQKILARLWAVRTPALWRLLHLVEGASGVPGIQHLVRAWADRSTTILREARGLERRYLSHRDWFYHNLASDLCRRYQQMNVVIPDQEDRTEETTPSTSSYRHLLAPARFVTFLRLAALKTGTEITMPPRGATSNKVRGDTHSVVRPSSAGKKLKHIVKSVA
ncbi:MAG: hypothetical protein HOP18_00480 [Deltaproteobacteria bacterium]|nr:hypothetical protein [Deltaproteobacteria bacterium]